MKYGPNDKAKITRFKFHISEGEAPDLQFTPDGVNVAVKQDGALDVQPTISGTLLKALYGPGILASFLSFVNS